MESGYKQGVGEMLNWIKKKLGINTLEKRERELTRDIEAHRKFVNDRMKELKDYTRVDADVGIRGNNTVILTGVYRKTAYVQFYDLGDKEFVYLVEMLKDKRGHALIRHIDCAIPNFKGIFTL